MKTSRFVLAGVLVTLVLAGVVSLFASSSPDGLESVLLDGCTTGADGAVTGGDCVLESSGDHEIGGVLADYGITFLDNEILGASLAGLLGVCIALGTATGLFWLLARGKRTASASESA